MVPISEDLKELKGEAEKDGEKMNKANGAVISKRILIKMFSTKDKDSDNESSDASESRSRMLRKQSLARRHSGAGGILYRRSCPL
ncbi:hypothetical protein Hdeb2414_s0023g00643061 [Helianthus debilis subsp. tardiflorus]